MQIGMVGLGRMGTNLSKRLLREGVFVCAYDVDRAAVDAIAGEGAATANDLDAFAAAIDRQRVAWVMVPAAHAGAVIDELADSFDEDDIIIDGGNSNWQDDVERAARLKDRGIHYIDVGTSGGVHGLDRGFSLMIGGEADVVEQLDELWDALAPGIDAAPRTVDGDERPGERGWLHCGPAGAGHFVKMVHNGIEYGMMAAMAEGLGILKAAGAGIEGRSSDAETSPLRDPKFYQYDIDTSAVAEVWRRGSVVSSWLVDLTAHALAVDPKLDAFGGHVSDSGEGRWTVQAAVELGVPANTIAASLFARFASRGNDEFTNKVLSAMRKEFGGHHEKSGD